MSDDPTRVIIFDTTLRDGEQAPGLLDGRAGEAGAWRARSTRSAWTSSRPASRSPRRPTPRPCGRSRVEVRRPVIAALARCRAAGHRRGGAGARAGRALAHPHVPGDLGSAPRRASCASRARRASSRSVDARHARARSFTDDVEFSAEDATRSDRDFLCRVVEAVDRRRRDHGQPARHRRLRDARRDPRLLREIIAPRAERRPGGLQRALPRRPRPGGRQQPRRDPGRRAAGRVHDQRHRRARRQRVARGDRDGAARPRRIACRTTPAIESERAVRGQPAAVAAHRASRCRRTRRSSAATRSRTKPASTRTAC